MFNSKFYNLIFFVFFISCQSSTSQKDSNISTNGKKNTNSDSISNKNGIKSKDTTGFFSNCQELINHASLGSLQGVNASKDSLRNFYFADCFDCEESFQIIFVHNDINRRKDENYNLLREEFNNGCVNYFKNFSCFSFICPMRDPDKQKDVHALNIDFPTVVKVYERISVDNWKFVKKITAKNFNEYALLRFKSIYHLQ